MFTALLIISALIVLAYVYLTWNFDYWRKRNVPSPKARPLLGDLPNNLLRQKHVCYDFDKIYNEFKGKSPFVGFIQTREPQLMLLEPELVKDVLIRKFNHFRNNPFSDMMDPKVDPLFAQNPFFLKDDEWKEKRAEITPAFTTSRLKALYPLVQDVQLRLIKFIRERSTEVFDARELSAKYTTDVVSNCIFGVDAQSFTREKPEIREMGRKLLEPSTSTFLKIFLVTSFPVLKTYVKVQFISNETQEFFVGLMRQALKYREENNVQREDFLDHIIQLQKRKNIGELSMAAHTISFFTDGFETSAVAIAHAFYELGKNKRVQDKLREEVTKHSDENGLVSFETLNEMPYLDQVFYESLRMHSPAVFTSRTCDETVDLEFEGKKVTVEKGIVVGIPIHHFHYDPDYFLEPQKFHPERYDDGELKNYRDRCVLIPFSNGARQCLGMKFALMQSKAALAAVVRNFEITVNEKTQDNPLILDPNEFLNVKRGGLWLNFKPLSAAA